MLDSAFISIPISFSPHTHTRKKKGTDYMVSAINLNKSVTIMERNV